MELRVGGVEPTVSGSDTESFHPLYNQGKKLEVKGGE